MTREQVFITKTRTHYRDLNPGCVVWPSDHSTRRPSLSILIFIIHFSLFTGKHLVFTTDPESVKDEFAFDNPGFRQEERTWRNEAPTLPLGGKPHALHAQFTHPERTKDDEHLQVR
jgi:hypothetical protein